MSYFPLVLEQVEDTQVESLVGLDLERVADLSEIGLRRMM